MGSLSNTLIINRMLSQTFLTMTGIWELNSKWGFLVYSEFLPYIRKVLKRVGIHYLFDIWNYELKVGDKLYDMKLIFLKNKSPEFANMIFYIVKISQFTFAWFKEFILFRALDQYHELEEFIAINNLKKHIINEEVYQGFNSKGQPIKAITFNGKVKRNELVNKFLIFLNSKPQHGENQIYHYYFTFAFPWLQPSRLQHFDIPLENKKILLGLQTFVKCVREMSNKHEPYLNFIDLCSLKLAFCDDRKGSFESKALEDEIFALIQRSLKIMAHDQTYIRNNEFNLEQYAMDQNCAPFLHDVPANYFLYTLQDYFKSFKISGVWKMNIQEHFKPGLALPNISFNPVVRIGQTINLVNELNVLKKLSEMSNTIFVINGEKYSEMNYQLFCDIIKCGNIASIVFDTNYKWSNLNEDSYIGDIGNANIVVSFIGENQHNFIEGFVASLKNVLNLQNLSILINTTLKDYRIFKNLCLCDIVFIEHKLTSRMLTELHDCNFKETLLQFWNCNLEDSPMDETIQHIKVWKLLDGFNALINVEIREEEKTWQYIFEYIADQLTQMKIDEFHFRMRLGVVFDSNKIIDLNQFKFTIDEFRTKLEIKHLQTGELLDIYDLKNPPTKMSYDKYLYEFYK